jgi:hypothetical protein
MACSHNHCVNGNTALCSLRTVKQPVTSNITKILSVLQNAFVVNLMSLATKICS